MNTSSCKALQVVSVSSQKKNQSLGIFITNVTGYFFRDNNLCFALGTFSFFQLQADSQGIVSLGLRTYSGTGTQSYLKIAAPFAFCKTISEQERLGWVLWLGGEPLRAMPKQGMNECQRQEWCCRRWLDPTGVAVYGSTGFATERPGFLCPDEA